MPLDVTVEHPYAWVVGDDAEGDGVHGGDLDGVSAHGVGLAFDERGVECGVVGGVVLGAADELEFVSVQMASRNC